MNEHHSERFEFKILLTGVDTTILEEYVYSIPSVISQIHFNLLNLYHITIQLILL